MRLVLTRTLLMLGGLSNLLLALSIPAPGHATFGQQVNQAAFLQRAPSACDMDRPDRCRRLCPRRSSGRQGQRNWMTDNGSDARPRAGYSNFKRISLDEDWFEVYEIAANLFVFHEPRHCEGTIVNLVIGENQAALIDTGCGIGNLRNLLDRVERILFCGDILLQGPVWTHLKGGSVEDLVASYRKLMGYYEDFDSLMPSHNVPWLDKVLLPEMLAGAERVLAGDAPFREIVDPWNRRLRQYSFGRFEILTRA